MQMNHKINGKFEKLFPITLGDNVKLNNGVTLEEWKTQIDDLFNSVEDEDYNVIWEGRDILDGNVEIVLPKKLSECRNGWILIFGDTGTTGTNYNYFYVPKIHPTLFTYAEGCKFVVGVKNSVICSKYVFIGDSQIKGHKANAAGGNEGAALIKIISH